MSPQISLKMFVLTSYPVGQTVNEPRFKILTIGIMQESLEETSSNVLQEDCLAIHGHPLFIVIARAHALCALSQQG